MTAVTVVTVILGYPAAVIPTGEHPVNAKCRRGFTRPFRSCKTTPAVRKIIPIFPTALQVYHYTLPCKVVCQTFPLDSLKAGLCPAILRLTASDKRMAALPRVTAVTVVTVILGYPAAVIPTENTP